MERRKVLLETNLIKKGLGKSLELSKNTLEKLGTSMSSQENDVLPYHINISQGIDLTEIKSHYLESRIVINDKFFKKRVENIFKEYRYRLCYTWHDENVGTLFKPKYEKHLKMSINSFPSKTNARTINLVMSLLAFGAAGDVFDFSNTYKLKDLNKLKIFFETEKERNLFSEELEEILNTFYRSHYFEYDSLKSNGNNN